MHMLILAGLIGWLANESGGRINITEIDCPDGNGSLVYATNGEGQITNYGCFRKVMADQIIIEWNVGKTYSYHIRNLTLIEE